MPEKVLVDTHFRRMEETFAPEDRARLYEMAEVVWGDGQKTSRVTIALDDTREFQDTMLDRKIETPNRKWARFAVWDVAGNGAMMNPRP